MEDMVISVPVNGVDQLASRSYTDNDYESVVSLCLLPDDLKEVEAFGYPSSRDALHASLKEGGDIRVIIKGQRIVGVFGVRPIGHQYSKTGLIWFIAEKNELKPARQFLSLCQKFIKNWNQIFPILTNYVGAEHTRAIKWLKYLGFTVLETDSEVPGLYRIYKTTQ